VGSDIHIGYRQLEEALDQATASDEVAALTDLDDVP
jgi:hypothetical protein